MLILTILPVIFNTAVYNISGFLDSTLFYNLESAKGVIEKELFGNKEIHKENVYIFFE